MTFVLEGSVWVRDHFEITGASKFYITAYITDKVMSGSQSCTLNRRLVCGWSVSLWIFNSALFWKLLHPQFGFIVKVFGIFPPIFSYAKSSRDSKATNPVAFVAQRCQIPYSHWSGGVDLIYFSIMAALRVVPTPLYLCALSNFIVSIRTH